MTVNYFGTQDFDTAVAEQRRIVLRDGSFVDLAPNSSVRSHFTPWRREVRLKHGQAFFSVAHESRQPFVVQADDLRVTALGTAFDVRLGANDILVTVSEGRVNVRSVAPAVVGGTADVRASLGQRVTFSTPAQRHAAIFG